MKPIILTSIIALFLSVANLQASEPIKVYNNIETSESGTTKEYTFIDSSTSTVVKKNVYKYDNKGLLLERTLYKWNKNTGWSGAQKYQYEYNNSDILTNIVYTKWDKDMAAWSSISQHLIHIYNLDGKLLSIKQIEVDSSITNMIANK